MGGAAAAVLAAVATVTVIVMGQGDKPEAQAEPFGAPPATVATTLPEDPATTPPETTAPETTAPETTPPETPPTEDATTEEGALEQLEQLRADGLATVSFDDQYAAQIASKYPGIVDKFQTTPTGSHTFEATDILAEHVALRDEHGSADHPVILVKSTDYGKRQVVNGKFLWVTFAIGDFADPQAVRDWCGNQFPGLSDGELKNQCAVRQLKPGR
ncbi:hypothetical protein [Actinoplanes sp. URMC 104]|uniref:hypothetical protein n=1 Tax=Actinoplanes sp. URMC 104 TaxID=3423409 RepID=UPI003F1D4A82